MDGYLWGHIKFGIFGRGIFRMMRGMSFAMKDLSAIRAMEAGKGEPADETRNRKRRRKSMSGLPDMDCQRQIEKPDNNDTSAVKNYCGRALARGMLRRERVPQGVMWPVRPVPHTPFHTGGE